MRTRWTYNLLPGNQWELVFVQEVCYYVDNAGRIRDEILRRTGYISNNLGDILRAEWYLNHNRNYGLTERQMKILDMFK